MVHEVNSQEIMRDCLSPTLQVSLREVCKTCIQLFRLNFTIIQNCMWLKLFAAVLAMFSVMTKSCCTKCPCVPLQLLYYPEGRQFCKRQDRITYGCIESVAHQTAHILCSAETKGGTGFNMKNFTEDA